MILIDSSVYDGTENGKMYAAKSKVKYIYFSIVYHEVVDESTRILCKKWKFGGCTVHVE